MMHKYLAIPYYNDSDPTRRNEIEEAIDRNIKLRDLKVILVCDTEEDASHATGRFGNDVEVVNIGKRQTYLNMMEVLDENNPDGINIISNADIFWTQRSLDMLDRVDWTKYILALTRWEYNGRYDDLEMRKGKDAQDSWVYHGSYFEPTDSMDIKLGRAGCDNRIAYELPGIINPSMSIVTGHIHSSEKRNYDPTDKVDPPYKTLDPTYLGEHEVIDNGNGALVCPLMGMNDQREIVWAFEDDYDTVKVINWKNMTSSDFNRELQRVDDEYNIDVTFLHIQTLDILDPDILKGMSSHLLNWTGDVRDGVPKFYYEVGEHVTTLFTNEDDADEMLSKGYDAEYLQIGFNNDVFKPDGEVANSPDIVFMGNHYEGRFPLSAFRYSMAHLLRSRYGYDFGLYGGNWDIECGNANGDVEKEAAIYRGCKIGINCSHYDRRRYSSDRILRIMGSGAFCLTRYFDGIDKEYEIGKHLDVFYGYDDLLNKIQYYLSNPAERMRIAKAGCDHVHSCHTWRDRMKDIRSILSGRHGRMKNLNAYNIEQDKQKGGEFDAIGDRADNIMNERHRTMSYDYQKHRMKQLFLYGDEPSKTLSILIPSIYTRRVSLRKLKSELERQISENELEDDVEILVEQDGGYFPIGAKRNKLIMDANGRHVMFIDDDDEVSDDIIQQVVNPLISNPQVSAVTFNAEVEFMSTGNKNTMEFKKEHKQYRQVNGLYERPPGHLNAIRRDIALSHPFHVIGQPGKNRDQRADNGSDVHFSLDMVRSGAITSEVHIPKELYFYKYVRNKEDGTK